MAEPSISDSIELPSTVPTPLKLEPIPAASAIVGARTVSGPFGQFAVPLLIAGGAVLRPRSVD